MSEAIDNVPEPYASRIENINFQSAEAPTDEQREQLGLRKCDALFGLYQGVPLPKRGGVEHTMVPDVITIFRHPMMDIHQSNEALKQQIFNTVWHEVAHYFGLDHAQIHALESKLPK